LSSRQKREALHGLSGTHSTTDVENLPQTEPPGIESTKVMGGLQASHQPPGRDRTQGEEMIKTPRVLEGLKPMTKAEREARKAFRRVDAERAMTEYESAQKAFDANRERLKAERLAREAAGMPVAAAKKAKTKKKPR
jgi:hypothetical protein